MLYLDDIQWMDDMTLDVLRATLLDKELKHLVFVASFRCNEVFLTPGTDEQEQPRHKVAELVDILKASSGGAEIVEMTIGNLTAQQIRPLLVHYTSCECHHRVLQIKYG